MEELGERHLEEVRLTLADLGSARPRLPKVVTKMFNFTLALSADLLTSQIIVATIQQICLLPDRHISVAGAAPITPSARSERLQHRARILPRDRLAKAHLADRPETRFMFNVGELLAMSAKGQPHLSMRVRTLALQQLSPTTSLKRPTTTIPMSRC